MNAMLISFVCKKQKESFDLQYIRKFAPKRFDKFDFCPSEGASGAFLFAGPPPIFRQSPWKENSLPLDLLSPPHNSEAWNLVVVYGPCRQPTRNQFVNCLHNLDIGDDDLWLLIGDFNFYRSDENRNRPGGNFNDTIVFNNIISHLGLIELPIKGRSYTWSNMQNSPLLEQVDWFFTSISWTNQYPHTMVLPLAKITSDHLPCKIQIGTNIPRANIFRFENYWFYHPGCIDQITNAWLAPTRSSNSA